jgi:hypothetical protein
MDSGRRTMLSKAIQKVHARFRRKTSDRSFLDLFLNCFNVFGMTVSEAVDADATDDIDERIAIQIGDGATASFLDHDARH